ncbi:MAG: FHA domain-containing protein [Kofleriaceae bacterium]|jgi:pSer/pThr/pTyr-binding forkhead associated (FHA) protein|nr:FHA domain-containing protein [Kofleriaceae bacterium]MBP6838462.1 FHA domain-containing protein [Kofleriaceae bacterium]MBP9204073.1 FHA domain-containing protein [Kofleriaceae bacterium]
MFKLVIQDDEGKTTVVPLIRDEITIGRKEGNTIRLTERNVSRRHARIVRAGGAVAIEDLGSYNGVRVNGTRIAQRTALSVSDRVQIGDYLIELKAEGVEQVSDDSKTAPIERVDPAMLEGLPTLQQAAVGPPADLTEPQRALPPTAAAVGPAMTSNARLVVLSSNFAGQEFELTRPQMVIGRTEDNEIVINHRSISRNHAKVVREVDGANAGRYTISDLQSSNGVRVNGEDYGKVELRRGDIVDLGHVRLRFVEAGEDFVFGRDAQVADVPTAGGGKLKLIAAAGILVVGAGIAALTLGGGGGGKAKPDAGPGIASGSKPAALADAAVAVVAVTADAESVAMAGPADAAGATASEGFDTKLTECRRLRDQKKWGDLKLCGTDLATIAPDHPDAVALIELADRESNAEGMLVDFNRAARAGNYAEAIKLFTGMPQESGSYAKAVTAYENLKQRYITEMKNKVSGAARAHKCKEHGKLIDEARLISEAHAAVKGIPCKEDSGGSTTVVNNGGGGTGPDPACNDLDTYKVKAKDATMAGQYSAAVKELEKALKCEPGSAALKSNLVLNACKSRDRALAQRYWNRFKALQSNSNLIQACSGLVE